MTLGRVSAWSRFMRRRLGIKDPTVAGDGEQMEDG